MRAVLDTNVVVSALLWNGPSFRLLQAATSGDIDLYTTVALLDELRDVLAREHLAARVVEQRSSLDIAMTFYAGLAVIVSPEFVPRVVPNDADDDQVIAAALTTQAQFIVSGDKHLHQLGDSYRGIGIVTPADAVRLIGLG